MTSTQQVRKSALALSASERANLAHDLILSLDNPDDFELGEAQEKEIQRRLNIVREGTASGRPAQDILSDIRATYK